MKKLISELNVGDSFKFELSHLYECYIKHKNHYLVYYGVRSNSDGLLGGCCFSILTVHVKPYGFEQLTLF